VLSKTRVPSWRKEFGPLNLLRIICLVVPPVLDAKVTKSPVFEMEMVYVPAGSSVLLAGTEKAYGTWAVVVSNACPWTGTEAMAVARRQVSNIAPVLNLTIARFIAVSSFPW
jgi:hypothetical protein